MSAPVPEPVPSASIDAPLRVKAASFAPTLGGPVHGPGEAETTADAAVGPRTAARGQHNWVSIGPRNVGGRVRAVAVEPGDPKIMYAAPASGGVFKSADGGDSWFPLWHDEPSLSMAALAISPANPEVVWAGTGETQSGGNETIPAAGVWRSPDRGANWQAPKAGRILIARIHALAADPTDEKTCWAAAGGPGPAAGLYRTTDEGQHWKQFAAGRGFTDVRFATIGGSLRLFAVLQGTVRLPGPPATNNALLVRLDHPKDLAAALAAILNRPGPPDPLLAVGTAAPPVAAGRTDPGFGKVAIYDGSDPAFPTPVVYLALTHDDNNGEDLRVDRSFSAMFRCRDAHSAAANAMTFTPMPAAETFGAEGQGGYNIALAVNPRNPNHLAFGMVELYLNRNADAPAGGDWLRAQQWDLNFIEPGHHADHHDLLFAPAPGAPFGNGVAGGALVLWDCNDGGISWCADWATAAGYPLVDPPPPPPPPPPHPWDQAIAQFPPPLDAFTWRKRSHGISATQMYSLTQHPRLPSVIGCGFQDTGVWLGLSGPSWQLALGADGGFVAFDPDDPYRMLVTYQEGITEARFPGRLRTSLPLPRDAVQMALWPRELEDGFLDSDHAIFTAATAFHPRLPGRVLTARKHRLYGTRATTGDRWIPEPLGTAFEIVHRPAQRDAAFSVLEVLDTPGGRALGLVPQRAVTERATAGEPQAESRVRSARPGPYTIAASMSLSLVVSTDLAPAVAPIPVTIPLTIGADLPASASASQVAAYLTTHFTAALAAVPATRRPVVRAENVVLPPVRELVIASTGSGHTCEIRLSGTALGAALDAVDRTYHGARAGAGPGAAAALPAIAPIMLRSGREGFNLAGLALRVTREGGTSRVDIDFDTELPPPASSHVTAGQLIEVLRRRLPAADYELWTNSAFRGLRLTSTATPVTTIRVDGNLTAVAPGDTDSDVALVPTTDARTRRLTGRDRDRSATFDTLDLTPKPADRTLRLGEHGHWTALQALNPAFLNVTDLTRVTMVELCHAVREMLAAVPAVQIRCDLEFTAVSESGPDESTAMGGVSGLAFGPPGTRIAYAGDSAGRIYRSTDDGEHWEHRPSVMDDRTGECDAIAVQPDNPGIVLAGLYAEGLLSADAVMLFRSTDGGSTFAAAPAQIDNGLTETRRRIVGIRALVFDPGAAGHVYAATDLGVHHSADAGQSWLPCNTGLPNVRITSLALATQTRMLRAGAWGRGVYERRLDPADVRDVRLHIRTTGLDDGTAQSVPGPDLLAPRPESCRFDASPDIKLMRHDPRIGVVLDGAEFDELTSEDVRAGPAFLAVQVHNRGAFPTPAPASPPNPAGPPVRVTALWAPADGGPPPVPPGLWAALASPLAVGAAFGAWKVLGDEPISGPAGTGHETVAPGYPRVVVLGAANAFAWTADVEDHARIGIIAIARSADDALPKAPAGPVSVADLIRAEAKIGYRECAVSPAAEDDQIVLRTLDGTSIAILAVAGPENAANGGAPFGLAARALPGSPDIRFGIAGPFALPARRRFRIRVRTRATATFAAGDPELPALNRVFATDAADVLNRAFVAAGVPVRASVRPGSDNGRLRLSALSTTRFTVAGNAAATFGVTSGAGVVNFIDTPFASRGPWNLTPAAPRSLTVTATTTVEIRLQAGQSGLPLAGSFSAAAIRGAITRQLARGGLSNVVCEPVRRRLSVRRSASEAAGRRHVIGSEVLADLVSSGAAVAAGPAREALFDVVTTHSQDTIAAAGNHFYLRAANVGNVREAAVRYRLFLVDTSVAPLALSQLGADVVQPLAAGASAIVEFAAVAVAGVATGDHRYVLAIADVNAAGLTLAPAAVDLASLDALLAFCQRHLGAAVREFVAR